MAQFNDFKKKEPNKTEKVLYDLMMRQEMADRSLWTNSAFITALAMMQNIDPKKIADILVNGNDKIKEYSTQINSEIDRLEKEKKAAEPVQAEPIPTVEESSALVSTPIEEDAA